MAKAMWETTMTEFDPIAEFDREFWRRLRESAAVPAKAHAEMMEGEGYQAELKFIRRMTDDIQKLLYVCLTYSTRAGDESKNSLVIRSIADFGQSVAVAFHLAREGLTNPVKRELRYVIESMVKYLYVDQKIRKDATIPKLEERLDFLHANVDSSIDARHELELPALHADDAKQFIDELYHAYRECCAYVHVSRCQIEERIKLDAAGRSLGFENADDLRKIGRLMFRVYDIALTLFFHGYDLSMTGDVFINLLDEHPKWKFHKGKYVACVSAYFDYKHERNMRKYGEPRNWSPEGWPSKRL
jgi:hypothetical protein